MLRSHTAFRVTCLRAERIARFFHAEQKDESGVAYIYHPQRVAMTVPEFCVPEAWLHDVLEDCVELGCDEDFLSRNGIPDDVIRTVRILTKQKHETYMQFILRICDSGDLAALYVKLHDLRDNLSRADNLSPERRDHFIMKYRPAIRVVEEALKSIGATVI